MGRDTFIQRRIQSQVKAALADTPVVLVNGPRQAGKITLVKHLAPPARHVPTTSLNDPATLATVREDPLGFVRGLDRVAIDEVQRVPELLLAIKLSVDNDRRPGRFLLTGSANVMLLPRIADSLAGRIGIIPLLPLAGCETEGTPGRWLDAVYSGAMPKAPAARAPRHVGPALVQRLLMGGYPEVRSRTDTRRRRAWVSQYVRTLVERDVRDIASIEKLDHLPRLLNALALMSGQLCNFAQLAGQIRLDNKTVEKYLSVFEQMFLLRRVPQWWGNALARIVKSPKIQFIDSGLLCNLLGLNETLLMRERHDIGAVLESYELTRSPPCVGPLQSPREYNRPGMRVESSSDSRSAKRKSPTIRRGRLCSPSCQRNSSVRSGSCWVAAAAPYSPQASPR